MLLIAGRVTIKVLNMILRFLVALKNLNILKILKDLKSVVYAPKSIIVVLDTVMKAYVRTITAKSNRFHFSRK